jgi:hypothetical protein
MIDRCPSDIACWSESGENFVVKNVEKFATVSEATAGATFSQPGSNDGNRTPHCMTTF